MTIIRLIIRWIDALICNVCLKYLQWWKSRHK